MALKRHVTYILPTLLAAGGIALGAQALAAHPHPKPKEKPAEQSAPAAPETHAPAEMTSPDSTRIIRRMVKPNDMAGNMNMSESDIEIVEQIEIIEDGSGNPAVRVIIVDGQPQLQIPGEDETQTMQDENTWSFEPEMSEESTSEAQPMTRHKRMKKRMKKRMRVSDDSAPQMDENGMRVIKLTGETIVKVGTDGQLEIYNNGRMIEPMSFAPADQGNMQTQVEDGGENMTLSVKKTVSDGDEGRKIHVEIDMEVAPE